MSTGERFKKAGVQLMLGIMLLQQQVAFARSIEAVSTVLNVERSFMVASAATDAFYQGRSWAPSQNSHALDSINIGNTGAIIPKGIPDASVMPTDPRLVPRAGNTGDLSQPAIEHSFDCQVAAANGTPMTPERKAECDSLLYLQGNPGYARRLEVQETLDQNSPALSSGNRIYGDPGSTSAAAFLGTGSSGSCTQVREVVPGTYEDVSCTTWKSSSENLCTVPRVVSVNWYSHHSCRKDKTYVESSAPPVCSMVPDGDPMCIPNVDDPNSCMIERCDPQPKVLERVEDTCGAFSACTRTAYRATPECIDYDAFGYCQRWDFSAHEVKEYKCDNEDLRSSVATYLGYTYTMVQRFEDGGCRQFQDYPYPPTCPANNPDCQLKCEPSMAFCASNNGLPAVEERVSYTPYCAGGICPREFQFEHLSVDVRVLEKECWGSPTMMTSEGPSYAYGGDGWVYSDNISPRWTYKCLAYSPTGEGDGGCSAWKWEYNYPDFLEPTKDAEGRIVKDFMTYESPLCRPSGDNPTECTHFVPFPEGFAPESTVDLGAEVEWTGLSLPQVTDNPKCVDSDPRYERPRHFSNTGNTHSLDVVHKCWAWSHQFTCIGETVNDCESVNERCTGTYCSEPDPNNPSWCRAYGSKGWLDSMECIQANSVGTCTAYDNVYKCLAQPEQVTYTEDCSAQGFCQGGTCYDSGSEPDQDLGLAVSSMEAARQAALYLDTRDCETINPLTGGKDYSTCISSIVRLFSGDSSKCTKKLGGLIDCCKGGGTAVGSTGMSNDILMSNLLSNGGSWAAASASAYMYDALFTTDMPQLMDKAIMAFYDSNWGNLGTFSPSFSYFGFTIGGTGSSLFGTSTAITTVPGTSTQVYFNPTMFWVSVAVMLLSYLMTCDQESQMTELRRKEGLCNYVGSYCSKKTVFGICLEKKQSYCCFNSRLAKAIQDYGRAYLHKGWGTAKRPDCKGFTMDEFAMIDFSADLNGDGEDDFSSYLDEFLKEIVPDVPSVTDVSNALELRVRGMAGE